MAGINDSSNRYTPNTIIVDSAGTTPFTTITQGLAAAVVLGQPTTVYVRPGTYNENLTLVDTINIEGNDPHDVIVDGFHTVPATGACTIANIKLTQSTPATNLFIEGGANTFALDVVNCIFNIDSGAAFYLPLCTGSVVVRNCLDISAQNSICDSTGGFAFYVYDSSIGSSTVASVIGGFTRFYNSRILAPTGLAGTSQTTILNSTMVGTVTLADTATVELYNSYMDGGAAEVLDIGATASAKLMNVAIKSSDAGGVVVGAGSCEFGEVTFEDQTGVTVTTKDYTTRVETGTLQLDRANTGAGLINAGLVTPTAMTDGTLLIGTTGAIPSVAGLTAGYGIDVTGAAGSITVAANGAGGGMPWIEVAADGALLVNNGQINTKVAALSVSLPATSAVGDVIILVGSGAGGWTVTQGAGQQIVYGNVSSTLGAGGSVASTNANDCLSMVCKVADTIWTIYASVGVLNVV